MANGRELGGTLSQLGARIAEFARRPDTAVLPSAELTISQWDAIAIIAKTIDGQLTPEEMALQLGPREHPPRLQVAEGTQTQILQRYLEAVGQRRDHGQWNPDISALRTVITKSRKVTRPLAQFTQDTLRVRYVPQDTSTEAQVARLIIGATILDQLERGGLGPQETEKQLIDQPWQKPRTVLELQDQWVDPLMSRVEAALGTYSDDVESPIHYLSTHLRTFR